MRLRTHVLSSPAFLLGFSVVAGRPVAWPAFVAAALGSVLPDSDQPESAVGRVFPLSPFLYERFGHRGLTHSLLGLAIAAGLFAPLALLSLDLWLALLVGYLSHLLLDMATLEGVPLLWPKPTRCVFPGRDDLRLDQAAPGAPRKELVISVVFLALAGGLWPLSQIGLPSALRRAFGTLEESLPEYQKLAPSYEVFLVGTVQDSLTGMRREGEWPIVTTIGQGYLVLDGERVRLVSQEGSLVPQRVSLRQGQSIHVVVTETSFRGPLRGLLAYVDPQKEHYISGKLLLREPVEIVTPPGAFPTVQGSRELTLTFARLGDLSGILGAWAEEGALTIVHRLRPGESLALGQAPAAAAGAAAPISMRFKVPTLSALRVAEGDEVAEGDRLAEEPPELSTLRAELGRARLRAELGLAAAAEVAKLAEEVARLEAQSVRAPCSGRVEEVRVLGADASGVDVVVVLAPGRLYAPAAPTAPSQVSTTAGCPIETYFVSPAVDGVCRRALLGLINSAQHSLDLAIYSFTDDQLGWAVVEAFRRGVAVRVIMDESQPQARGGEYQRLTQAGIPVVVEKLPGLMHHKFLVVDGVAVATGSYNWSEAADDDNFENLVIIRDANVAEAFAREFQRLWEALSQGRTP